MHAPRRGASFSERAMYSLAPATATAPHFPPTLSESVATSATNSPRVSGQSYAIRSRPESMASFLSGAWNSDQTPNATMKESRFAKKYALSSDPRQWSTFRGPEPDDDLHDPKRPDARNGCWSWRILNAFFVALVFLGIVALFAGYPIIHAVTKHQVALNTGGASANVIFNVPQMKGRFKPIDPDTPQDAHARPSYMDPSQSMQLVFSDEFEVEGRTFYPGDDPYWQAVDLNYWQTGDLEWYDPAAIMTRNGALEITLSKKADHGFKYTGGMLQGWNMMCFTGGLIEVAVTIPGSPDARGFWPAVWMMGNLGRVGYGGTTDGLWPYSYDSCDYGTVANQSVGNQPPGVFTPGMGDQFADDHLSFLPGQRLSRCTCSGESHPGPKTKNGFVGRAAPEIDIFEAQANDAGLPGNVSQSLQIAPFNDGYYWFNGTGTHEIYDPSITSLNPYRGGAYQQAISGLTNSNQSCYERTSGCFAKYGVEYVPGGDNSSYITWISNDKKAWTLYETALLKDDFVEIGARPIAQEPMYLIMNLGLAGGFDQPWKEADLIFPTTFRIDYVRVYQHPDQINIGCDPKDFPTSDYINTYPDVYQNPNWTTFAAAGYSFPKNSFLGQC